MCKLHLCYTVQQLIKRYDVYRRRNVAENHTIEGLFILPLKNQNERHLFKKDI